MEMFDENLEESYIVDQEGTSDGTQIKYYKDGYWYKKDSRGQEGLAEYLVSHLLEFSDLKKEEFVIYEQGKINGKCGCRSKNFLRPGDELVTLYRLYYNEFGKNLSAVISQMETMEERIEYVLDFVRQICNVDLKNYFCKIFTLDMIVLNEDRHLNNLALIFREDSFLPAPIFDNGVSLLTANQSVNWYFGVEENVRKVIARPFSGSHVKMQQYFGVGFHLDIIGAEKWLQSESDSREKEVLQFQLNRYKELF